MFELTEPTTCRVLDVRVLSRKDRGPDELPGAQLLLRAKLGVGALAMFDGFLPGMLYRKSAGKKQGELDGLETAELTSVGEHVKRLPWVYEQTGCTVVIDLGLGGSSNIELSDVKVHRLSIAPEQSGVVVQWTQDAPGLSDATRGRLSGLKSTDIQMTVVGPEVDDAQQDIERAPAPKKAKGAAAARADNPPAGADSKKALDEAGNPFGAKTPEQALAESTGVH